MKALEEFCSYVCLSNAFSKFFALNVSVSCFVFILAILQQTFKRTLKLVYFAICLAQILVKKIHSHSKLAMMWLEYNYYRFYIILRRHEV